MREVLDFVRRRLPGKNRKSKRGKKLELSSMLTDDSWSFLHFRSQRPNCELRSLGTHRLRKPRGSNGNRLFPWRTTLLARSSELYLLRPQAREWVPPCFRRHRLPGRGQRTGSGCAQAETGGCTQEDGAKSSSGDKREDCVPSGPLEVYKIPRPRRSGQTRFFKILSLALIPDRVILKLHWYRNRRFYIPLKKLSSL